MYFQISPAGVPVLMDMPDSTADDVTRRGVHPARQVRVHRRIRTHCGSCAEHPPAVDTPPQKAVQMPSAPASPGHDRLPGLYLLMQRIGVRGGSLLEAGHPLPALLVGSELIQHDAPGLLSSRSTRAAAASPAISADPPIMEAAFPGPGRQAHCLVACPHWPSEQPQRRITPEAPMRRAGLISRHVFVIAHFDFICISHCQDRI